MGLSQMLKLGIDIDGVLAENDTIWAKHFNSQVGKCHSELVDEKPFITHWGYWDDICENCINTVISTPSIVTSYTPYSDAFTVLNRWFNRGAELYIITSRPQSVAEATKEWLNEFHFLPIVKEVFLEHDKYKICEEYKIDYMLDDAPRNIYQIAQYSSTTPVIFLTEYNKYINNVVDTETGQTLHIPGAFFDEVKSWEEFDEYLEIATKNKVVSD